MTTYERFGSNTGDNAALPPLPRSIPTIPYNNLGHREHPDPDGEESAIPLSDQTFSYQGKTWAAPDAWPYQTPEAKPHENSGLNSSDIELLSELRSKIDRLLSDHERRS